MADSAGETGSRLLDEAASLCDLLRVAHATTHRMQQELHGDSYERVVGISQQLHELNDSCSRLYDEVEQYAEELQRTPPDAEE